MPTPGSKDPLHGVTLERLLTELVAQFGWKELGRRVDIRCFQYDASIKSSLVFLRKTPWARAKVEQVYIDWKTGRQPDWAQDSKSRIGAVKPSSPTAPLGARRGSTAR